MRYHGRCQNHFCRFSGKQLAILFTASCYFLLFPVGLRAGLRSFKEMQWQSLQQNSSLHDVSFVGNQFGFAVGDRGVIHKTVDGGASWKHLASPVICNWRSVCFLTDQIGWVAGGRVGVNGLTSRGVILHTRDAGETWKTISPIGIGMIFHVQFFDFKNGVICGESTSQGIAGVWQTADGGKSWHVAESSAQRNWRCGAFTANNSGVVGGSHGRVGLLGGSRLLDDSSLNLGLKGVNAIALDVAAKGWLVGDGGLLRYSPAGASWQDPPRELPAEVSSLYDFRAVAVQGDSVWIAGHPGSAVWYSHDGGKSWEYSPTGITVPINALHFSDRKTGWAVCELGIILKTEDGGRSWRNLTRQSRRLALLQLTSGVDGASFCLSSRYGGHHRYRTGLINYCREDQKAANQKVVSDDIRQYQATIETGGEVSRIGWALPLEVPGLAENQKLLIQHWEEATDGQLSDVVLSHLVRDLRCYRPSVVVIDLPEPGNEAQRLFRTAVHNAVRSAGDPTWMVAQKQFAFLSPWKTPRLFERSRTGQGGNVILDANEYLLGLNQSVRMAAGPAYQQVFGNTKRLPFFESFTISKVTPLSESLQLHDLFTGIIFEPGGAARRKGVIELSGNSKGEAIAKKQRNYAAYSRRMMNDERQAGQMIAQLDDVISGSSPRQAVLQLLELADQYQRHSKWDYYEAVLMQILESFPQEPLSSSASVRLIQFWSSQEMSLQRLRIHQAGAVKRSTDRNQFQKSFNQILQTNRETPALLSDTVLPSVEEAELNLPSNSDSEKSRLAWDITWQQRALSTYEHLMKTSPEVAASPAVQLPLASMLRQRGARRASDEIYRHFLVGKGASSLRQIAESEFYLQSGTGIPTGRYSLCKEVEKRPHLDALLSDDCWQNAEEIRLRYPSKKESQPNQKEADPLSAMVLMAYDSEYLYVAASCPRHPDLPAELPAHGARKHDENLARFDRLQLSIDINRDYHSHYQLEVDQRGLTRDSCVGDINWDPKWFVACEGEKSHWRVEIAIPLKELLGKELIKPGDAWAVSLSRIMPGVAVQSWSEQKKEQPDRASFGILRFQ